MPTNMFDEARRRVSSGTNASSTQNDNIFSQARSRVNTGQTVDAVPAKTQRSAASPLPTRKKNLERIDLGQNEGKIGEGWERRVNTESLVGPSYKDTTAYYDRILNQKKQKFEAVKPDSNFLQERQRLRNEIDRLEREREAIDASGKRGSFKKEGAGGFGSDSELHINPRSTMQTVADTIAWGAGQTDLGALKAGDFLVNAIPRAAGAIRGVDPEETFTGQLFKPITDATGQAVDWMQRGVDNVQKRIDNDVQDNKFAKIATELGAGVVSAIPNAALAMMTGGASAGGAIGSQLAPQATGLSGTILSAWNKMVSSPMFQVSFAQTLGNSYDEAKQAGASDMDAMAAALLSTTANAMVEVGGGIETLPGEISGADLSSGKKALKWLTSALDEGKEEVVQGVISNMVNKAAGTENRPYFSMTDENAVLNPYRMGQEFAIGTAVGGIMGGGQVLADTVMNRSKAGKSALDFAIEETLKPTQEKANLDMALEGLFEKNKTDKADTGAERTNVNTNPAVHTPQEQAVVNAYQEAEQSGPVVNGNTDQSDVGDLGAKTSDFKHDVKQSQTAENTIGKNEARWGVPEDQRVNGDYDAITERESLNNARMRIEQDLPGEMEILRRAATWSNEEVDMGMIILGGLRAKAKESGDWSQYREWSGVVKQHGVTSGQALQAWAKYTRKTGDGIMQRVSELLENSKKGTDVNDVLETASDYADRFDGAVADKSVSDLVSIIKDTAVTRKTKRNWGKKLGGQIDWALNRIAAYAETEISQDGNSGSAETMRFYEFLKNFAAASIENIAADQQKVSAGKMAMTIRRNGMLSKASTIMRNLVGNGVFDIADSISRDISVPLDMLLSKITGTRSVAMDYSYLSKAKRKGMMDGLAMAMLETSLDVNARDRSSKYESGSQRTFKMSGNVVSKLLSTWESAIGYGLYVTDEMAKGATSAEIQRGLDKLYEHGKIRDDSLRSGGEQEALYRTFQDKTLLSDISIGARNVLNKAHVGDVGLGDIALPFAQVPANLADRAIDYSPAGLAESAVRLASVLKNAKNGKLTAAEQAQAVQNLGRNITGSALIAIAAGLALKSFIRVVNPGDADENKDKAAFEKMQGQSGTQFNVSAFLRSQNGGSADWQDGDTLVSIAFLEPFNAHLTIGALLAEDMKEEGQLTAKTIANDTFTGSLAAILDLPMFEKFRDVSDAYTYSKKERSGEKLLDAVNTLAANEVGSLVPNAWKGIAKGLDPYQRDLYSKEGAWEQTADQFRAVFDRDSLPIKQDSFGRDMKNEGGTLNFLNTNILPGQITTYKTDELLDKITDLSELTGKPSVYPSRKAPDKITVDGEDVPLDQEQQRQYQSTYGQTEYETRSALIGNSLYDNLTPQEEIKAHSFAEDYAKQVAKSDINADFEPDSWVEDLKGKTPAEVADAIMLKTMESIVGNKKVYENKYDGMADLLEKNKLDDAIAITMMPETMQTAYRDIAEKGGVSVQDWLDAYAYAYANGKTNAERRSAALDYIDKQNLSKSQKTALANGLYSYLKDMIPKEAEVSDYWLLDQGASGLQTIEANMNDTQKENYDAYIKNSGVDMKNYLDAWDFKGTAKSDKDKDGNTTKSAMEKVIEHIDQFDASKEEKRNIFLGLGYAKKNIPWWWK